MARKLFGTDGIRGVAGEFPLDPVTVYCVGAALGQFLAAANPEPEVIVGVDTRESGPALAGYLAGGLAAAGARVRFAGVITTPGVAYLTRTNHFVAGVMISASHNPFQDNGIKVFDHSGYKLPDPVEERLEEQILTLSAERPEPVCAQLAEDPSLDKAYLDYLVSTFPYRLEGWRIALDCAHGAASLLAPALFERLGAAVEAIGCEPDGRNINQECGALHLEPLRQLVRASRAKAGVALDGDADRCILVSPSGQIVDGDGILLVTARYLARRGRLPGPGGKPAVVATVMSNLGLEKALEREGIAMLRAPVGDRYVLEEMLAQGIALGGEQSGHVIFHEYATTGDGLLTALRVFEALIEDGLNLDESVSGLERYPQRLVNVRVRSRPPLEEIPEVKRALESAQRELSGRGRILLRYSGTELLARVMVEAADQELVDRHAELVAEAVRSAIGA
jgi:phosphoglucosamine mutase